MWKESRMGPFGLKPQGAPSNAVGVWLKYLWVSLSHLLGLTREAPRFDTLTPPCCPSLDWLAHGHYNLNLTGGVINGYSVAFNACEYTGCGLICSSRTRKTIDMRTGRSVSRSACQHGGASNV